MKVGFDIETNGLDPWAAGAEILSAVAVPEGDQPAIYLGTPSPLMTRYLGDPEVTICGHNLIAFDVPWWETHVGRINAKLFDTRVAYALLDETGEGNHLAELAQRYCGITLDQGMKAKRKELSKVPLPQLIKYNHADSVASLRLALALEEDLITAGLYTLFLWLMRSGRVLTRMIYEGVKVDVAWVEEQCRLVEAEAEPIARQLQESVKELLPLIPRTEKQKEKGELTELNLNSPQQLSGLLFGVLLDPEELAQVPGLLTYTPSGQISTDASALMLLSDYLKASGPACAPLARWVGDLLEYRRLSKLSSTYLKKLATEHLGVDGRVHTTYNMGRADKWAQTKASGTVTGRLSSSRPNLQNQPRDPRVKGAFIPSREGLQLFEADYSQLEIRVGAWYAQEERMLEAFATGKDIHTATLAGLAGRPYEEVAGLIAEGDPFWNEQRTNTKPVNFLIFYGGGPYQLRKTLRNMGIDKNLGECEATIHNWKRLYPKITEWIATTQETIIEHGEIVTPTGRVRRLPDARSNNKALFNRAMRQGVNFMVQSFATDIMFAGLRLIDEFLLNDSRSRLLLTVHDSVVGEYCPENWPDLSDLRHGIADALTTQTNLDLEDTFGVWPELPLRVDIKTSLNRWGEK